MSMILLLGFFLTSTLDSSLPKLLAAFLHNNRKDRSVLGDEKPLLLFFLPVGPFCTVLFQS